MVPMRGPEHILTARKGLCLQQGFLKQEVGSDHLPDKSQGAQFTDENGKAGRVDRTWLRPLSQPSYTHTHTLIQTHTLSLSHTDILTDTLSHTLKHMNTHADIHIQSHTLKMLT